MKQKNLFLSFIVIIATGIPVYSQTIEVEALESFSTSQPPQAVSVKFLSPVRIDKDITISGGLNVQGKLVNIKTPKRLKRNAKFSFQPIWYIDENGNKCIIHSNVTGKYTTELNKAGVAKNAALSVGNHFVKGLSMGVAAVEGAVENAEGNRLKSSAISLYEASPASYVEKGKDINISKGQIFYLKFPKVKDNTDENT